MVTKAQAVAADYRHTFHYTGRHECARIVGPRGGVRETIVLARVSGKCQTWKTRPDDFRLPVKHGLYESSAITPENAGEWHLAEECPIDFNKA